MTSRSTGPGGQHSWGETPGIVSKAIRARELRDGGVREGIRESVLLI